MPSAFLLPPASATYRRVNKVKSKVMLNSLKRWHPVIVGAFIVLVVAAGGKQRMPIREYYPGEKRYRMCYVEDPFGIVFEVYSHSYELTYSEGAYS